MNKNKQKRAGKQSGFTVIEMALATTTLMVGIMSISAATLRMHQLSRQNHEKTLAFNSVHGMAERLNSASAVAALDAGTWLDTILEAYGPGGTLGDTFEIQGLTPAVGNATVGTIEFITNETLSAEDLGLEMGMPRDLNGDGDANDASVLGDARMLGVVITARWRNKGVDAFIQHPFYIMGY